MIAEVREYVIRRLIFIRIYDFSMQNIQLIKNSCDVNEWILDRDNLRIEKGWHSDMVIFNKVFFN